MIHAKAYSIALPQITLNSSCQQQDRWAARNKLPQKHCVLRQLYGVIAYGIQAGVYICVHNRCTHILRLTLNFGNLDSATYRHTNVVTVRCDALGIVQ